MGGTQDREVLLQTIIQRMTGQRVPAAPFTGIMDAVILDNDQINDTLPAGTARVTIPAISTTAAYGPAPYPGTIAPAPGTGVVVAFIPPRPNQATQSAIRILSLPGVSAAVPDIPIADDRNAVIDDTSYPNTLLNDGSFLVTLVSQIGTAGVSLAQDGDDFPEIVLATDGGASVYLGDGTFDPVVAGSGIFYASGVTVNNQTGVTIQSDTSSPLGFFGAAPVPQQATPTDVPSIVALLQAYGLSA